MKVVIVGGVAGGATAAARIRRLNETARILVFERSGHVSYANCGLPYYLGGVIEQNSALSLQTPESFWKRFRVEMKTRHEVTAIHPDQKTVSVRRLEDGMEFEESYDKLLLSPGARPVRPPVPGLDSRRLFTLRTVEDTTRIHRFIQEKKPRSAVLAGGGFISLELAENLKHLGMDVTIVQMDDQLLLPFDKEMASFLHTRIRQAGIRLLLGHAVTGFSDTETGIEVQIQDSPSIEADMAVLAIGVAPDTDLARKAGLKLGAKGSIAVNDHMETSIPSIYAVGDAVEIHHGVTGAKTLLSLAGPANKQGRIAADNICGRESRYRGAFGSSVLKVFDLTAASTGLNERAAKAAGISCDKVYLSPASHASYYPGGEPMAMKVLFEPETGRLLGAQIVGRDGVDKRIDVLASALFAGLSGDDLADLDLAYAPPYSSAKDPVNMAGYMIENLRSGLLKQFFWEEADAAGQKKDAVLLDVRTGEEYERSHIPGARNIPLDQLRDRLGELDPALPVYAVCQSGLRSYLACRILSQHGYECFNLSGGFRLYESASS